MWALLHEQGLWLSLIGNADGPERGVGPPRLSARQIAEAVEPCFEILKLRTTFFDSDATDRHRAWGPLSVPVLAVLQDAAIFLAAALSALCLWGIRARFRAAAEHAGTAVAWLILIVLGVLYTTTALAIVFAGAFGSG